MPDQPLDQLGVFAHVLFDGLALNLPTIEGPCLCAVYVTEPGKAGRVLDVHTINRHRDLTLLELLNQGLLGMFNRYGADSVHLHVVSHNPDNVELLNTFLDR